VSARVRQAAGLLLTVALAGALAACGGGGFNSAPLTPPSTAIRSYVALGDGFTAAPYVGQAGADDGCLRSTEDYPALAARKMGLTDVRDVSCTHATTNALTAKFKPGKGKPAQPAQLDAVGKDTDLVSISAGIEDHDLLHAMFRICLVQPCAPGTVFYTQVLDDVTQAADALTQAIRAIQTKAPKAYIVVVGYPRLTPPPESGCKEFPPQAPQADRDVVNYVLDQLNDKIRSAALQTGSGYVDVAKLSDGHELCSPEPWVHGMTDQPGKAVAYHPLEAEQRAVADQLVAQVKQR
jgi:hypothetical protein